MKQEEKKRRFARGWCLGLVFLLLLALAVGCTPQEETNQGGRDDLLKDLASQEPQNFVVAFFPDQASDNLIPLSYHVNETTDGIALAVEKILAGPPNQMVKAVLPEGIKLQDLFLEEEQIELYLQGEAPLQAAEVDFAALAATIYYGIYQQGAMDGRPLMVYYNDQPLLETPYEAAYVNDYSDGAEQGEYVLYSDSQAMYLVPVRLACEETEGEAFYQELLEHWAAEPPRDSGLYPVTPEGTEVLGCSLADGCLTVNLNEAVVSYGGGSAQETLLIDSLLALLRPYDEVQTVQLLVEGEKVNYLPEGTDIGAALTVPHEFGLLNKITESK